MIEKEFRKEIYLRYMKKFLVAGENEIYYQALEEHDYADGNILLVRMSDFRNYELYRTWKRNGVLERESEEKQKKILTELASFVKPYPMDIVTSADRIHFIDPHYNDKFVIPNFGFVNVNGEKRQVFYMDECHFGFVHGSVYHIREWAERCHINGIVCERCGEPKKLSRAQVKRLYTTTAIYFVRKDGSTSLVQDNDISLERCLKLFDKGYEFFVD